jgi:hypothetical protein
MAKKGHTELVSIIGIKTEQQVKKPYQKATGFSSSFTLSGST